MTKQKKLHTPAPWQHVWEQQDGEYPIECVEQNKPIAWVKSKGTQGEDPEGLANAHLIAAAPELLEALELIVNCHTKDNELTELGSYEMNKVKQAIAKAQGELK